ALSVLAYIPRGTRRGGPPCRRGTTPGVGVAPHTVGAVELHPAVMAVGGISGSLDEAYEELAHAAAELPNGFVNHGPMACEALVALGYEDRAPEWAHRYALTPVQVASGGD